MISIKNILKISTPETLEDIISPFIESQFPDFMKKDHTSLILFIKAYYEWLESNTNPGYFISKLNKVPDVDIGLASFYEHFQNTYMNSFPDGLAISVKGDRPDKSTLLKNIKEFYKNKGTESSYKFLFRLLYDSDVDLYTPRDDILKCSDGIWIEPISIKTTKLNQDVLFDAKGGTLYQKSGSIVFASAQIESVVFRFIEDVEIAEFFLSNISGTFTSKYPVIIKTETQEYTESIYNVLGEFFIEHSGKDYSVGDTLIITDENGIGFSAFVESIGLLGNITKIYIRDSGINYADSIYASFISTSGLNQTARVLLSSAAITKYPGYFKNNSGRPSSAKRLQDGDFYNNYSYVLKSEITIDKYFNVLQKLVHPAGMKMFGSVLIKRYLKTNRKSSSGAVSYENPIIGKYTPYTVSTVVNLRNNGSTLSGYWLGTTGDLYPLGYNPYISNSSQGYTVGATFISSPTGTIFIGTSLGYTYCTVGETGKTSHNPLGSPLGSSASWYLGKEQIFIPNTIPDLILWLSPEGISGQGGSTSAGTSLSQWNDMSGKNNHGVVPTLNLWTGLTSAGSTSTVQHLCPIIGACGGLVFNGGVIYGADTLSFNQQIKEEYDAAGDTLGISYANSVQGLGDDQLRPEGYAGISGLSFFNLQSGITIQTGTHFYLKNEIKIKSNTDMFVVFKSDTDGISYGKSMISSFKEFYSGIRPPPENFNLPVTDSVIYNRSFNEHDRTSIGGTYGSVCEHIPFQGTLQYPNLSGLIGFKVSEHSVVAYDPHVSGVSLGVCVGEWQVDNEDVVYGFLNGDRSTNSSLSTGKKIVNTHLSSADDGYMFQETVDEDSEDMRYYESNDQVSILSQNQKLDSFKVLNRIGAHYLPYVVFPDGITFGSAEFIQSLRSENGGFKGTIFEILVFERKLEEYERQEIYGYLSRKYKLLDSLPDSFSLSRPSASVLGTTWWNISSHPNSRGLDQYKQSVVLGASFGVIQIKDFLDMPSQYYSSGRTLFSSGVSVGDTYGTHSN